MDADRVGKASWRDAGSCESLGDGETRPEQDHPHFALVHPLGSFRWGEEFFGYSLTLIRY